MVTGTTAAVALTTPIALSILGASPFPVGFSGFNALGSAAVAFLAGVHVSGDTKGKKWREITPREKYGEILALFGLGFGLLGFGSFMFS